jgi:uncharacterized protein YjiS (DUF1127 family)
MTIQQSDTQTSTARFAASLRSLLARFGLARKPGVPRLKAGQMSDYQLRDLGLSATDLGANAPRRVDLYGPSAWR